MRAFTRSFAKTIVALILAAGLHGQRAADADSETQRRQQARAYFDATILTHGFGLLRSEFLKSEVGLTDAANSALHGTRKLLDQFIRTTGGSLLLEEAVRRFENGNDAERIRAQLILARCTKIPDRLLRRLAGSARLDHRVWAAWWRSGGPNAGSVFRPKRAWRRPVVASSTDPVADVAAEVRARLKWTDAQLQGFIPEYQDCYRKVFLPALQRLAAHFPRTERFALDFDGDGIDEQVVCGCIPDGFRNAGVGVTLILRRTARDAKWKLAYFRRWDVTERSRGVGKPEWTVADFDGDGRPECAEHTQLVAGWYWEQVHYFDATNLSQPDHFVARTVTVARLPGDDRPIIVERSAHNPTGGGKSMYLATVLATQLDVVRYQAGKKPQTACVLVRGTGW